MERFAFSQYEISKPISKELDELDLDLISALNFDPHLSDDALGKQIGLYGTEIKKRILKLKELGVFRKDQIISDPILGEREITERMALYIPETVNLHRINVILNDIKDKDAIDFIDKLVSNHPYIHFKAITFTTTMNYFIQFDLPKNAITQLNKIFDSLVKYSICSNYKLYPSLSVSSSKYHHLRWKQNLNKLEHFSKNFNTSENGNSYSLYRIQFLFTEYLKIHHNKRLSAISEENNKSQPIKIDTLDANLIKELNINERVSGKKLADIYKKSQSTISKRIKKLRKKVLKNSSIIFDRSIFNLSTTQIFTGTFDSNSKLNESTLINFVKSNHLGLETELLTKENEFIWLVNCPADLLQDFSFFIWNNTFSPKVHHLYNNTSMTYFFPSHLLKEDGSWEIDKSLTLENLLIEIDDYPSSY